MKILMVNTQGGLGGAGIAAYRLHKALLDEGIDSHMLVQNPAVNDYCVSGPKTKVKKTIAKILPKIDSIPLKIYKSRTKTPFSPSWVPFSDTVYTINKINPDIVHLHWICKGMIRIEHIARIKAPIVWSLHDMWAFTGGCHYDEGCGGFKKICGNCKVLGSDKENDLSRKVFKRKQKVYPKLRNIAIIGLSHWLECCAKTSSLFRDKLVLHLPNSINTDVFRPFDKLKSRQLWNLPKEKKIILFGAMGATDDPRKGFQNLRKSLSELKSTDIEIIIFGSNDPGVGRNLKFKTHYTGYLYDEISLITLYAAADVFVLPTLQDNLPNTIMEALSCGIPCVSFNVGGVSDMIQHKHNGYLASPFEPYDLARGIEWVLNNTLYDEISMNARQKVIREFENSLVAKKYIQLYNNLLSQ